MNPEDSSDDLAPPELRFRYSDFVLIGTGGMGRVLGAHDSRLNRAVAIKLLPRNSENALAVMRFQHEAKAVSKLNNPHVVQVLDFGYTEAGEPYLVMEQVKGSSLEACLETHGAFSIPDSIDIAVQLCSALEHAHSNEIVHRDLKLENVMVESGNVVKVLDFGLARIASMADTDWRLTRPGQPVGSILYMSPEQVRGEDSDERADVYSLGLLILKMVIGQLPFEGKSALEIIKSRLEEEPPVIPELPGTALNQALRIELNEVIQKALAFHTEDRYQNMAEFRTALLNVSDRAKQMVSSEANSANAVTSRPSNLKTIIIVAVIVLGVVSLPMVAGYMSDKKKSDDQVRLSKKHPVIITESDAEIRAGIVAKQEALTRQKFEITGDREHGAWKADKTVTDEDLSQLVGLPMGDLTVDSNHLITSKGIETLTKFPVRRLVLRDTDIDDRSFPFINKMKSLSYLDLQDSSRITDEGIMQLSPDLKIVFLGMKKLERLGDRGLLHVIKSFPNLEFLSINGTGVGKTSFRQIPKLTKLRYLHASALELTDEDIKSISEMKSIEGLDLDSNPITDKSIPFFEKMAKKNLRKLTLELCAVITPEGMQRMQTEMKTTEVTPKPINKVDDEFINLIKE